MPHARPRVVIMSTVGLALRTFLRPHLQMLVEQGFDVFALSSPGPHLDSADLPGEVSVRQISMPREISPCADLGSLYKLVKEFRRIRPHVVHSHTPKAGLLGMLAATLIRVPLRIHTIHGLPYTTQKGWRRYVLMMADFVTCRLAHQVLCVSESVRRQAVHDGTCSPKTVAVPGAGSCSGIDLARFDPARFRPQERRRGRGQIGIPEDSIVILFVGRLVIDKGLRELHAAWRVLRDRHSQARLLICGIEDTRDACPVSVLEDFRTDPRVHTVEGFVTEMPRLYSLADICVLPSYREGLPTVVLEASAMGVPVVATRIAGCIDSVIDGLTGILVTPRQIEELTAALSLLVERPDLRDDFGSRARRHMAAHFAELDVLRALLSRYRQLLKQRIPSLRLEGSAAHEVTVARRLPAGPLQQAGNRTYR